jgi:signal transduction histidine kinase
MHTRTVTQALRTVLFGVDRGPSWLAGRPAWQRRLTVAAVTVVTVVGYALCAGLALRWHPIGEVTAALIALGTVLPLALLIRFPLLAWRAGWLAALLTPLAPGRPWGDWPWEPPQIPVLGLAFCVVGLRAGRAVLWTMWALMLAVLWLGVPDPANSVGGSLALTAVTVLLDVLADRRRTRQALTDQTERTREERRRRAALEDRAQLARELHDVVAHHMSLVAVQAETAPYRHPAVDEPIRAEFTAISAAAREALTEMRRLLASLRSDEPPARAPQPTLRDVPELVEERRRAGQSVELSMMDGLDVPATVGLCVYRVLQESLSNAGRHAPGASVVVTVDREPGQLHLSVHNGLTGPTGPVAGHGLAGMRERVTLLGGSLTVGPDGADGFTVRASFPVTTEAAIP